MKVFETNAIRNVALIGHGGEGKTSLAEAMLFNAKSIDRLGRVDDGNSTLDYDPEEIARKISIGLSAGYAVWKDVKINVLDTPGFFDFEGEVIAALHVCEAAVIVTSASGNMTVGTEKALEMVSERKKPAILFVNGVTKENANYVETVNAIRGVIAKAINLLNPEKVVMGGGIALAFDRFGPALKATVEEEIYSAANPGVDILPTPLGYMAGPYGAAAIAVCRTEHLYE